HAYARRGRAALPRVMWAYGAAPLAPPALRRAWRRLRGRNERGEVVAVPLRRDFARRVALGEGAGAPGGEPGGAGAARPPGPRPAGDDRAAGAVARAHLGIARLQARGGRPQRGAVRARGAPPLPRPAAGGALPGPAAGAEAAAGLDPGGGAARARRGPARRGS